MSLPSLAHVMLTSTNRSRSPKHHEEVFPSGRAAGCAVAEYAPAFSLSVGQVSQGTSDTLRHLAWPTDTGHTPEPRQAWNQSDQSNLLRHIVVNQFSRQGDNSVPQASFVRATRKISEIHSRGVVFRTKPGTTIRRRHQRARLKKKTKANRGLDNSTRIYPVCRAQDLVQ
jgi:hypothetical protein